MKKENFDKQNFVNKTQVYLIIIAIQLIIICIYNSNLIMPSIVLYLIIFIYSVYTNSKRTAELVEHIKDITINVDSVAKKTLINSPFPMVIVDDMGSIVWKTTKFIDEFDGVNISPYIKDIVKEVIKENSKGKNKQKGDIDKQINIGDKNYKILGKYAVLKNDKYSITLYFLNDTDRTKLEKKLIDSNLCVSMIMLDNYDEIFQRYHLEERPQLFAEIEKNIYDYFMKYNSVVIKLEKDSFIAFFDYQNLLKMVEDRFSILDKVKEIKKPGYLPTTLSITVSSEGRLNTEKYKSAIALMDIALGRGGDQAVVKVNGKTSYYGGKSVEVEKRTKVKSRIVSKTLEDLILKSENVIVMGHINGDIDSFGSSLGIYRFAKSLNKTCYVVNNNTGTALNSIMNVIKEDKEYSQVVVDKPTALNLITKNTLLVIVDTCKSSFVEVPELLKETSNYVIIDHHRRNEDYITNAKLVYHEVYASSAAELVTEIIEYSDRDIQLTKLEAESLYAGIMTDTKNFTFKTGVRTFEAAAFLRKTSIDIIKIKKWFQSDLKTYNQVSNIVNNAELYKGNIAIAINEQSDKDTNVICAKAADELLTISMITASFVIGKIGTKIYISGRSIGGINVQVILEKLGGGGHSTLAGAQLDNMTLEEVKQLLITKIDEYFNEI